MGKVVGWLRAERRKATWLLAAAVAAAIAVVAFELRRHAEPEAGPPLPTAPDPSSAERVALRKLGWIAFTRGEEGEEEVWLMRADGSSKRNLTKAFSRGNEGLSWSPTGDRLAFVSARSGNDDIYLLNLAEGELEPVKRSRRAESSVSWAPNGARIAFLRDDGDPDAGSDLYVLDLATLDEAAIGKSPVGASWDPRGDRLAYVGFSTAKLTVARADGRGERTLVGAPLLNQEVAWSPDGRWIAYLVNPGGVGSFSRAVALVSPGRRRAFIPRHGEGGTGVIAWAPDAKRLAFEDFDGLYVLSTEGRRTRLVENGRSATWASDGRTLVFVADEFVLENGQCCSVAGSDLYVMRPGQDWIRRLTHDGAYKAEVSWRP